MGLMACTSGDKLQQRVEEQQHQRDGDCQAAALVEQCVLIGLQTLCNSSVASRSLQQCASLACNRCCSNRGQPSQQQQQPAFISYHHAHSLSQLHPHSVFSPLPPPARPSLVKRQNCLRCRYSSYQLLPLLIMTSTSPPPPPLPIACQLLSSTRAL